jgi:hypothetical protein
MNIQAIDYLVHFSNILMLLSYSVRDILWLRWFAVAAALTNIPYFLLQGTVLWPPARSHEPAGELRGGHYRQRRPHARHGAQFLGHRDSAQALSRLQAVRRTCERRLRDRQEPPRHRRKGSKTPQPAEVGRDLFVRQPDQPEVRAIRVELQLLSKSGGTFGIATSRRVRGYGAFRFFFIKDKGYLSATMENCSI